MVLTNPQILCLVAGASTGLVCAFIAIFAVRS